MDRVLLVAYETRTDALELVNETARALVAAGYVCDRYVIGVDRAQPSLSPDSLVVSLGGDGTFLRSARVAHQAGAHVMGVNLGRVGFLVPVPPEEIVSFVTTFARGELITEERLALEVTLADGSSHVGINEVVVERSQPGHMARVRASVDGEEILTFSADGVLVATPTGSTGYNFSAGGPVVATGLHVMTITPIAPHFTIDRSLVVADQSRVELLAVDRTAVVVVDSSVCGSLEPGEAVEVRRSAEPVRVALPPESTFGARLRHSLREGHA